MIENKYETKTVTITDKVLVSEKRYCDVCDKEITGHYWRLTTGHHDWGNDSCESIEHEDICSAECLTKKFQEYIADPNKQYHTRYFEVEHKQWSGVKGDIKYD